MSLQRCTLQESTPTAESPLQVVMPQPPEGDIDELSRQISNIEELDITGDLDMTGHLLSPEGTPSKQATVVATCQVPHQSVSSAYLSTIRPTIKCS